jgi:L-ribulose-5-phosphate 4-epimerase
LSADTVRSPGLVGLEVRVQRTVLEEIARMAFITLQVNPKADPLPSYIVNKHYLRKHGPNAYYGQAGSNH